MTRYFQDVDNPHRLLARERSPVSGRRVPKASSKRGLTPQTFAPARTRGRSAAIAAGSAIAILAAGGLVVALAGGSDPDDAAVEPTVAATAAATLPPAVPIATAPPPPATSTSTGSTVAAASTSAPATTIQTPSTALAASILLTSLAAATAATVTPTDPGATATYSGPLPAFNFAVTCTSAGCEFSMRAFSPGTVTDEGLTSVPATAGRFSITSTRGSTCTTSGGSQLSREITNVIDLTLSGSQVVNGVSVPQQIAGTLTTVTPDAGYVPKVGEVVDEGADVGCAGQTLTFDVAGDLVPG